MKHFSLCFTYFVKGPFVNHCSCNPVVEGPLISNCMQNFINDLNDQEESRGVSGAG